MGEKTRRGRWRTVIAVVLIAVAGVCAPVAVVARWVSEELSNTAHFVATVDKLVEDPAIQNYVTEKTVAFITSKVDIAGVTASAATALSHLDIPPQAAGALQALAPAAANALTSVVTEAVSHVVSSPVFAEVVHDVAATLHSQLVDILSGRSGIQTGGEGGVLSADLSPLIEKVKPKLEAAGFPFSAALPSEGLLIPITPIADIEKLRSFYSAAVAFGTVLPWVVVILLVAAIVCARVHLRGVVGSALAIVCAMVVTGAGLLVGQGIVVSALSPTLPGSVSAALYGGLVSLLTAWACAWGVLAVAAGVGARTLEPRSAHAVRVRHAD